MIILDLAARQTRTRFGWAYALPLLTESDRVEEYGMILILKNKKGGGMGASCMRDPSLAISHSYPSPSIRVMQRPYRC